MAELRIVFMGTPELARVSFEALLAEPEFRVLAVVTQPDRPKGRALKLTPSPVKELAQRFALPVLQPERARNEDFIAALRAFAPELIAVAAFGQILPQSILEMPRWGCFNVHTSLLPKYRGAGPIQWAIMNGDTETGATIMKMDVGLDTGDILAQERTAISAEDTAVTLHDRLARLGAALLVRTIKRYIQGELRAQPQPAEGVTHAPKIKKHDGLIDWREPAPAIWNRVRGLLPWPGAFTHLPVAAGLLPGGRARPDAQPRLLKIWHAAVGHQQGKPGEILEANKGVITVGCGQGALQILSLQLEGGRRLSAQEFLAGHPLRPGQFFG